MTEKELRYHQMYMAVAKTIADRMSFCERKKVGSVIVKGGNIIAYGWNGMPKGEPNICELDPDTTNPLVLHAEKNALNKLRRSTETSVGADLYVTMCPCKTCAIEIVDAEISRVFYLEIYRCTSGIDHLTKSGIPTFQLSL